MSENILFFFFSFCEIDFTTVEETYSLTKAALEQLGRHIHIFNYYFASCTYVVTLITI